MSLKRNSKVGLRGQETLAELSSEERSLELGSSEFTHVAGL